MMARTLTQEQSDKLAYLLVRMKVPRDIGTEVLTVIETPEELLTFLDILSESNYEMKPEEVYQAAIETILQHQ